ncbi:MAG: PIG-L family deacetylase [Pseudomonadota bacterium]
MMLLRRIFRYGKKRARAITDIDLRKRLQSRPRPPRPVAPLDDLSSHTALVVMAHPDDEAIAAGALLARFPRAGVICITDGAPRRGNFVRNAGFDNWMDYADARRGEAEAALALLGRKIEPMRNLGIADMEAALNLVPAARHLAGTIGSGFSHVITHAYEGGHPDHDSAAFCVHAACALIAKAGGTPPVIVEAPLYNAPERSFQHSIFVPHADAGPVAVFKLSPAEQDLKRRMFDCYVTQRAVFEKFDGTQETYRLAPRYHFSAPPYPSDFCYNMGAFTGAVWRKHAWRAMRELGVWEELA